MRIELPLMRSAEDRGQDLLRVGTVPRTVATVDFAGDHRRSERLLRPPIRGVDRRRVEGKREKRGPLDREVRGEPSDIDTRKTRGS